MLTYLFEKMKTDTEYNEVKQLEEEIERRRKAEEDKEAKEAAKRQAALEAAQQEKMETLGRKYVNFPYKLTEIELVQNFFFLQVTEHFREMSLKEKLLQKKKERQAETQKSDVKLEEFSDEEYDTQRRFRVSYSQIVSYSFVTLKT